MGRTEGNWMIANDEYPAPEGRAQWRELAAPLGEFDRNVCREPDHPRPMQSLAIGEAPQLLAGRPLHVPDQRLRS
jgi:hypothetical protein